MIDSRRVALVVVSGPRPHFLAEGLELGKEPESPEPLVGGGAQNPEVMPASRTDRVAIVAMIETVVANALDPVSAAVRASVGSKLRLEQEHRSDRDEARKADDHHAV